jgi:streptogramin lyase
VLNRRLRTRANLIEMYWSTLRHRRVPDPPTGLDDETAALIVDLDRHLTPPDAGAAFVDQLWLRLAAAPAMSDTSRARPAPASSPRRATRAIDEAEEQRVVSDGIWARPEPIPLPRRRWFREGLKIAAAALVFGIVGAILVLTLRDDDRRPQVGPSGPTPTPTSIATATAAVVPTSLPTASPTATEPPTVTATAPPPTPTLATAGTIAARVPVGNFPIELAAGAGAIWVPIAGEGTVARIDPATNQVVATIPIGEPQGAFGSPYNVAARGDEVWVADNGAGIFKRIDPATNEVVQTISAPSTTVPPYAVLRFAVGDGALWYLESTGDLVRLDTATGQVVATIEIDDGTSQGFVAVTEAAVWVQSTISVHRVDPATNQIVATIPILSSSVAGLLVTEDAVWTAGWATGTVYRIDPATNEVVAEIQTPGIHWLLFAATSGSVWIASNNFEPGALGMIRIDAATNQVAGGIVDDSGSFLGITAHEGSLWLSSAPPDGPFDVVRIDPAP